MLRAWVDESIHVDAGRYILTAYIVKEGEAPAIAERLRRLRRGRSTRMHWHRETDTVRRHFLLGTKGIGGSTIAVVGTGLTPSKQERARRQCLQTLLIALDSLTVSSVVLERRSPRLNIRDEDFIRVLRGQRWITTRINVEFGDPHTDPLLWMSDAMCAVIASSEAGNDRWQALVDNPPPITRISLRM